MTVNHTPISRKLTHRERVTMANINPMAAGYGQYPHASKKSFVISGMVITVFGLEELPAQATDVSCLWLLHPRLNSQEGMEPIASAAIADWNTRREEGRVDVSQHNKGLIAVSLDQRNHGTREVDKLANEAWRSGNPRHAQDMFSTYSEPFNPPCALPPNLLALRCNNYFFCTSDQLERLCTV